MSYCRFLEGDVYVFLTSTLDNVSVLECCGCIMSDPWASYWAYNTEDMVTHLEEHIRQGHDVPSGVIPALRADDQENFHGTDAH